MPGTDDILGHGPILDRLWAALGRDALHHAYLFEGPDGVGKRKVAVRLAQAANCERVGELDTRALPCGACRTCRSIDRGDFEDVILLEPDPGRKTPIISVGQVREVVRRVGYHRYTGRRRFVIVDPAEALQDSGANALLKTLEEPPDGTGFVLIAHHASALLPTIVSRCQRVRFAAVDTPALVAWLDHRGVEGAEAVARLAMGRPGAAVALAEGGLESRKELQDQLLGVLGSGDLGDIFDLSKAMATGDRQVWRPRVEALLDLIEDLLRDATVIASGAEVELLEPDRRGVAEALARDLWPTGIHRVAAAITDAREGLERNVAGRTVLDALLVRFGTEVGTVTR